MAKAYSEDLRSRVLLAYESGESQKSISKRFLISEKTIYLWRHQRLIRGHSQPITKYQKGYGHKIKDLDKFRDFVLKNQSLTIKEMAKAWGGVSKSMLHRKLQALNFSRKKKLWLPKPERSRTPQL